jgi:hypothetical protein
MPEQASSSATAETHYNLTSMLGDLGSLPFILLAGLMANAHFNGPGLQSASLMGLYAPYVFIAYRAVILSFLSCGSAAGMPKRVNWQLWVFCLAI